VSAITDRLSDRNIRAIARILAAARERMRREDEEAQRAETDRQAAADHRETPP